MCWYTVEEYRELRQELAPYILQHERVQAAERKVVEAERQWAITKATNTLRQYKTTGPARFQRGLTWGVARMD